MSLNAILLQIVLPVCCGLFLICAAVLAWRFRHFRKERLLRPLSERLSLDRMKRLETDMTRISMLAKTNSRYQDLFDDLRLTYDELDNEVSIGRRMYDGLKADYRKLSAASMKLRVQDVNHKINGINALENKFVQQAALIIDQDELLRAEFAAYKEALRTAVHHYESKRLLLDKVTAPIEALLDQARRQEKALDDLLTAGQTQNALRALKYYGQIIVRFCNVLNEAPNLQTYVYDQIPRAVEKLTQLFKENHALLSDCMPMSHFERSLQAIMPHFGEAKAALSALDFERTRELIREILKTLRRIERQINFELQSRQILAQKSKEAFQEVRHTLSSYDALERQIGKLVSRGMTIPLEIKDLVDEASALAQQTRTKYESFMTALRNSEMLYSARVSRGKMLLEVGLQLLRKIDEISQVL